MSKLYLIPVVVCLLWITFSKVTLAQPGEPYNPETYDGATNIGAYLSPFDLRWVNPPATTYNEVYLSYDSAKVANLDLSVRVLNGSPDTIFTHFTYLFNFFWTRYYWRIVEYNSLGRTIGPNWRFITKVPYYDDLYSIKDDFINGTSLWNLTGDQYCKWKFDNASSYTLPAPAYGNIISVKNSQNGSPDSSFAYFNEITIPASALYYYQASVDFDCDLKLDNSSDAAFLDYSTDHGLTWTTSWSKTGQSDRNIHIWQTLFTNSGLTGPNNIKIRLRCYLVDNTSSWAIDNFNLGVFSGILTEPNIGNLHTSITGNNKVLLNFDYDHGSPYIYIYRKNWFPLSPSAYTIIDTINGLNSSYIDETTLDSSIYTYKVSIGLGAPLSSFYVTNEATAYINKMTPVELTSFSCRSYQNRNILSWSTATETNNKGFYAERSGNKKDWVQLGFVKGAGTTVVPQSYSITDNNASGTMIFYRLKQVDYDGTYKYSNVMEANLIIREFQISQNYPNPFNPNTTMSYSIAKEGNVKINVYNAIGSKVATIINECKPAGSYTIQFTASNLASGIYLYRLESGNYSAAKKFNLMK